MSNMIEDDCLVNDQFINRKPNKYIISKSKIKTDNGGYKYKI